MPTEPSAPISGPSRSAPRGAAVLADSLERFWPSRRGHAFDEFCR